MTESTADLPSRPNARSEIERLAVPEVAKAPTSAGWPPFTSGTETKRIVVDHTTTTDVKVDAVAQKVDDVAARVAAVAADVQTVLSRLPVPGASEAAAVAGDVATGAADVEKETINAAALSHLSDVLDEVVTFVRRFDAAVQASPFGKLIKRL